MCIIHVYYVFFEVYLSYNFQEHYTNILLTRIFFNGCSFELVDIRVLKIQLRLVIHIDDQLSYCSSTFHLKGQLTQTQCRYQLYNLYSLAILSLAYRSVEGGNLFLAQKMFLPAFAAAARVGWGDSFFLESCQLSVICGSFEICVEMVLLPSLNLIFILHNPFAQVQFLYSR